MAENSELLFTQFLPEISKIARNAGKAILEIYNDDIDFQQVEWKSDNSPLTLADQAAHHYIVEALSKLSTVYPVLSEESKGISYEERSQWQRFWLVDPLDGTKEFIKRNGEFTVNIALVEAGAPILGCVHVPVKDLTYTAYKGGGAFRTSGDGQPEPITANAFSMDQAGLRFVCSRSHMSEEVSQYVAGFAEPETVSMGSSLKFMLVAEGQAEIYPRLAPTMEWDTAAAHIIVEEAGGKVVKHTDKEALSYNKEDLLNPHFIAFAKVV